MFLSCLNSTQQINNIAPSPSFPLCLPLQCHLSITIREVSQPPEIEHDEVDKGTRGGRKISRLRNAMTKAKEKLKRDSSSSSSSFDSEDLSTSEENAGVRASKEYLTCSNETSSRG